MRKLVFSTEAVVCDYSELDANTQQLIDMAKEQTKKSYSPYSHFAVGAALRMQDGQIFTGSNQENAAYPSGLCAERTTIFYASAQCPNTAMVAIALATFANGDFLDRSAAPCGACRQVLLEYEHKFKTPIKIILYGKKETIIFDSVQSMMPMSFTDDDLLGK